MAMFRVKVRWSGGSMGAGLSVFAVNPQPDVTDDTGALLLDAFHDYCDALQGSVLSGVTMQPDNVIESVDETTGTLLDTFTGPAQAVSTGIVAAPYAAGVGSRIRWATDGIRNGRRVVGTTFIVPISASHFESNGTLTSGHVSGVQAAASGLLTQLGAANYDLGVWSRPSPENPVGAIHSVTGASVPDRVSWLRTRRS